MNKKIHLLMLCLMATILSGCVAVFVAGAAAGGLIVSDQRDLRTVNDDAVIRHQLETHFAKDEAFRDSHILVANFNRVVLLVGETPYDSVKVTAEKLAREAPKVKIVYNEITIRQPIPMTTRSKDTLITSDVKTRMLAKSGLRSGSIKVVTENGTVFLMGYVSHHQSNLAVEVARKADGVKRVVKIFQYN